MRSNKTEDSRYFFAFGSAEPNAKKYLESSVLLERIGEPDDIGDAVVFLLSEKSNYITGQIISVDGGSSIN